MCVQKYSPFCNGTPAIEGHDDTLSFIANLYRTIVIGKEALS